MNLLDQLFEWNQFEYKDNQSCARVEAAITNYLRSRIPPEDLAVLEKRFGMNGVSSSGSGKIVREYGYNECKKMISGCMRKIRSSTELMELVQSQIYPTMFYVRGIEDRNEKLTKLVKTYRDNNRKLKEQAAGARLNPKSDAAKKIKLTLTALRNLESSLKNAQTLTRGAKTSLTNNIPAD